MNSGSDKNNNPNNHSISSNNGGGYNHSSHNDSPSRQVGREDVDGTREEEREDGKREAVIEINLSNVKENSLPSSVKLRGVNGSEASSGKSANQQESDSLEVIIRPAKQSLGAGSLSASNSGKALWRKREVVKQERTIHYTTIDDDGGLQELVEKETTQTEVLHMECKETGEFAHRELTEFEHVETFNDEVGNFYDSILSFSTYS